MRCVGSAIFVLSLLVLNCGRTSHDDSQSEPEPPGSAGGIGGAGRGKAGAPNGFAANSGFAGSGDVGGSSHSTGGGAGAGDRGGSTGRGGSDAGGSASEALGFDLRGDPIYTRVQRLSVKQWEHAVNDILRFAEPQHLSAMFTQQGHGTRFDNNERALFVDESNILDFQSGAEAAAAIATGSAESLALLYDGDDAAGFVSTFGRRAFRRPLTMAEETKYQAVFALGEELYGPGFANGAALVIRAMLQSPHFLYRTELGPAGAPLNDYELASKLSFWLLGTTPSDALLDAAGAGELASVDGLVATAREMLEDARSIEVMRDFHSQLLRFGNFENISKPGVPEYDPAMNAELLRVSEAFFDHIYSDNFGLQEIFTSSQAYVGPLLAPLYGMMSPVALELRDIGPERSGYFMQVPFLMATAEQISNPIRRGIELQQMLCAELPEPPAVLPPPPPPPLPGETGRQRATRLTSECGGACHRYIDPLGFALENFDGLGRRRDIDNGQPIDASGSYPFAEGIVSFADGTELMRAMAHSTQAHTCYSKNVTSYALGRDIVERDRPLLETLAEVSMTESLKELVIALVREPAFRVREEGLP